MATPVIMPRQGQSVESCIITKWHKVPGDSVAVGDILFSYETDKAAFEEESKVAGTLLGVFFAEGDDVACLTNVCVIGDAGEDFAAFDPNGGAGVAAEKVEEGPSLSLRMTEEPLSVTEETLRMTEGGGEMKISPRAKALAEARFADLSMVAPTGPEGRVIARDVQKLIDEGHVVSPAAFGAYQGGAVGTGMGGRVTLADLSQKPAEAAPVAQPVAAAPAAPVSDTYEEPLTHMRKVIAKAMVQSLSSMAQLTHNASFDATQIQAARKLYKEQGAALGMDKITLNDIVLYAVSRTLAMPEHRALNANLNGDTMKYFRAVNLGLAVDTERGLMVPVLYGADKMSLQQISQAVKALAKDCQAGTINPDLLKNGSFTVSNLGSLGIESFTPVINPPQTGILGVNTITTRIREEKGQIVPYPAMALSLTYDHRAVDGAPASKFLRDLCRNLENFNLLLAKG